MKPDLTNEQKDWFTNGYKSILEELPKELSQSFANETISWVLNIPHFSLNSHQKLPRNLKDKYVALKNKLDGRNFI